MKLSASILSPILLAVIIAISVDPLINWLERKGLSSGLALLRDLSRQIVNVVTHGLMVQTIFMMIFGILLAIGAWQATPDSALMKWEASHKEKEATQAATEASNS